MSRSFILLIVFCVGTLPLYAQRPVVLNSLNLFQAVELAKDQSPASLQSQTVKENRYWQYKTFQSNYRSQLLLSGRNNYDNEVTPTRLSDGSFAFPQINQNYSALTMSLEQQIALTGSRIFISSSLERFDNFINESHYYRGNPGYIGFTQPLFFFNYLKWDKKIAPLQYEESKREFVEDLEQISVRVTELFFDMLLSQSALDIAKKNLNNNEGMFSRSLEKQRESEEPGGELLQLELSVMRSRQQVAKAELDLETNTLRLKSYIGINSSDTLQLMPPVVIPDFTVSTEKALTEAHRNRQATIAFKRRKLEAARGVAWAKGSGGIDANINATFGLTNQGDQLDEIYNQPLDQQTIRINFSIPVMDWGRQLSRNKTAEANQKLTDYVVAQDQVNFEQEVITHVRLFGMIKQQVKVADKSISIAQRRYELSRTRYLAGEASLTDFNIAMQEKDEATRSYIIALRDYWRAYFQLRKLTLYDFEHDIRIVMD